MFTENKKSNVLYVLDVLREYSDEEHRLTQKQISELVHSCYGVEMDRRTVKSSITTLLETGYNIGFTEITRGRGDNENTIITDCYLIREFTDGELSLLIDSILCSKHLSAGFSEEIARKLKKMGSRYFRKIGKNDSIADNTCAMDIFISIEDIGKAIASTRKISFLRNEWQSDCMLHPVDEKPMLFSPYRLAAANNYYYIVGKADGESYISEYRLDMLSEIKITDIAAEPNTYDIPLYISSCPEMLGGKLITAEILTQDINGLISHFGKNAVKSYAPRAECGYGRATVFAGENDVIQWMKINHDTALLTSPVYLYEILQQKSVHMKHLDFASWSARYNRTILNAQETGFLDIVRVCPGKRHEHEHLDGIHSVRIYGIDNKDCRFLKNYPDLRSLSVIDTKLGSTDCIKDMHNLTRLELANTGTTLLDFLYGMPLIEVLSIYDDIDDLSPIYSLKNLRCLRVSKATAAKINRRKLRKVSPWVLVYIGEQHLMPELSKAEFGAEVYEKREDKNAYPSNIFRYLFSNDSLAERYMHDESFLREFDTYMHFCGTEAYNVLTARFREGLSLYEISKKLSLPVEYVIWNLDRCRDFRECIEDFGDRYSDKEHAADKEIIVA